MSKTFKSPLEGSSFEFNVGRSLGAENVFVSIAGPLDSVSMAIAQSDAPALCLAILEAAGVEPMFNSDAKFGTAEQLGHIQDHLHEYVKAREATAAAEADRVALEAEALVLHNAFCSEHSRAESFDEIAGFGDWLAVARAAREINKEDGQ